MEPRDPQGYARRNWRVLGAIFAAFAAFGLIADNLAALIGGVGGLVWVASAKWGFK